MAKQILLVDDDAALAAELGRLVGSIDAEPVVAGGAAEAIARLREGGLDLCITDLQLPDGDGPAVVRKARACRPPVPASR